MAQVLVGDGGIVAQSDDFDQNWRIEVERIVEGFGLPKGAASIDALFAIPFGKRHVAVVSVAGWRFRFLILTRQLYDVIPDPFAIADRYPPNWDASGSAPSLEWPEQPLPRRTVAWLDDIFKNGDGPFLLALVKRWSIRDASPSSAINPIQSSFVISGRCCPIARDGKPGPPLSPTRINLNSA